MKLISIESGLYEMPDDEYIEFLAWAVNHQTMPWASTGLTQQIEQWKKDHETK